MTEDRLPPGIYIPGGRRGSRRRILLFLSSTTDPQMGADAIASGHRDALMLARQLLADPEHANKVRDGRIDEIVMVRPPKLLPAATDPQRSGVLPPEPPHGSGRARAECAAPLPRIVKRPAEDALMRFTDSERVMAWRASSPPRDESAGSTVGFTPPSLHRR